MSREEEIEIEGVPWLKPGYRVAVDFKPWERPGYRGERPLLTGAGEHRLELEDTGKRTHDGKRIFAPGGEQIRRAIEPAS